MQINIIFDAVAQAASQAFKSAIQTAASVLDATFSNNISLNIEVGYNEYPEDGSSENSGGASAAPSTGVYESYSQVRSWLANNAVMAVQAGISTLPQTLTVQGQSLVAVWRAQEKLMGQISSNDMGLDGYAGFAANIPASSLEGVALHELTHAMGRVNYGPSPDILTFIDLRVREIGCSRAEVPTMRLIFHWTEGRVIWRIMADSQIQATS